MFAAQYTTTCAQAKRSPWAVLPRAMYQRQRPWPDLWAQARVILLTPGQGNLSCHRQTLVPMSCPAFR